MDKIFDFLDGLKTKITDFENSLSKNEAITIRVIKIIKNAIWFALGIFTYVYL